MSIPQQFTVSLPRWKASSGGLNLALKMPLWVPDPCPGVRAILWLQSPDSPIPSNMIGDITLALDAGGSYCAASGFPASQNTPGQQLFTMCDVQTAPGFSRSSWNPNGFLGTPAQYSNSNNDLWVFAPETGIVPDTSDIDVQVDVGFQFLADSNIIIPSGTNIYDITLDGNVPSNSNIGIRNVLTSTQTSSGTKIRVRVKSLTGAAADDAFDGFNLTAASIGLQAGSTSSMQSSPVTLTFQGQPWLQLSPDSFLWSDWAFLATAPGDEIMTHFDLFGGITGNDTAYPNTWAYKTTATDGNFSSAAQSAGSQNMNGTVTWQANRTHIVDQIEIA